MPTFSYQWKIDESSQSINILVFEDEALVGTISVSPNHFDTTEKIETEARSFANRTRDELVALRAAEALQTARDTRVREVLATLRDDQPVRPTLI